MVEPVTSPIVELLEPRLCGRCRQRFPGDPTLPVTARPGWWLCASCHDALLGPERQPS